MITPPFGTHTRRGAGTRVRTPPPAPAPPGRLDRLAHAYVRAARALGADDARLAEAVHEALGAPAEDA